MALAAEVRFSARLNSGLVNNDANDFKTRVDASLAKLKAAPPPAEAKAETPPPPPPPKN